jgi:hypothetical protein
VEQDNRSEQTEREAGGVTRNQHAVYTLPHDWSVIDEFLKPALDRSRAATAAPRACSW